VKAEHPEFGWHQVAEQKEQPEVAGGVQTFATHVLGEAQLAGAAQT